MRRFALAPPWLREGVDLSLGLLPGESTVADAAPAGNKAVSAINGVRGDHLEASGNPLAIDMCFATPEGELELTAKALAQACPRASPHLVVFVHGLCLSDQSWTQDQPGIGDRLLDELGYTPLYLRYNTGRHISTNGRELAALLEKLAEAWPVTPKSISLIGHSMGGLVIRSACWYANLSAMEWPEQLNRIVCLGTPHHGAPLEKFGHWLDSTLENSPYIEPLLFTRSRSAGIKDLRHGNLLDEDWQDAEPFSSSSDSRQLVPMLEEVDYYFVAATVSRHEHHPTGHLLGDLLVRMGSATGTHREQPRCIPIRPENCRIFTGVNHFRLLDDPRVQQQIVDCSTPPDELVVLPVCFTNPGSGYGRGPCSLPRPYRTDRGGDGN